MRLRNKIRELKQQHAELRQIKEAQQQQLLASVETLDSQGFEIETCDQAEALQEQCLSETIHISSLASRTCCTTSDASEQSSAES